MMIKFIKIYYSYLPHFLRKILLRFIIKNEGGYMYSKTIREEFKLNYNIDIGYGSYGGCFNPKNIAGSVIFGNYCSTAPNFRIYRANHPKEKFTTHPILYNPLLGYVNEDRLKRPKLIVGHDVWIGEWAIILPTVRKIGNGAIIGAGCVLTKDVEPYSIVVGNPGKVIGKRFNDSVINEIEKLKWWDMKKDELFENIDYLNSVLKCNSNNIE